PVDQVESWLIATRQCLERWANVVRGRLGPLLYEPGDPAPRALAAQLLLLGAALRGKLKEKITMPLLWSEVFSTWSEDEEPENRSAAWIGLWRAFKRWSPRVRELVQHTLSCTKGGRAGSFVDPSSVLHAIERFARNGRPDLSPPEAAEWSTYAD